MRKRNVKRDIRKAVFERALHFCEYCLCPIAYALQPFAIEHILPRSKGGEDELSNLACACGGCNGHKSARTKAIDPADGNMVPLYNPRYHVWQEHFIWNVDYSHIIGITAIGRATEMALRLNRPGVVNIRMLLLLIGEHPPAQMPEK
jgi:HNH endonuclease